MFVIVVPYYELDYTELYTTTKWLLQHSIIIIIIIELYLNTVLFHKLLTFNLIMYKREGKEKM